MFCIVPNLRVVFWQKLSRYATTVRTQIIRDYCCPKMCIIAFCTSAACLSVEALLSSHAIFPSLMRKDWRFGNPIRVGTPNAFATVPSVSAINVKGSLNFSRKLLCAAGLSPLTPMICTPNARRSGIGIAQAACLGRATRRVRFRVEINQRDAPGVNISKGNLRAVLIDGDRSGGIRADCQCVRCGDEAKKCEDAHGRGGATSNIARPPPETSGKNPRVRLTRRRAQPHENRFAKVRGNHDHAQSRD